MLDLVRLVLVKNITTAAQGHFSEDLVKGPLQKTDKILHYFFHFCLELQHVLEYIPRAVAQIINVNLFGLINLIDDLIVVERVVVRRLVGQVRVT